MPTEEQLASALRNAHAAGDAEAARKIANAIKQGRAAAAQPEPAAAPARDPRTVDLMSGLAEIANTVNSGIPALLDLPPNVVNWIAEKAGSDFRIPATMLDNYNSAFFGEGNDPHYLPPGATREAANAIGTGVQFAMGAAPVTRFPSVRSLLADVAGFGSTAAAAAGRAVAPGLMDAMATPGATLPVERTVPAIRPKTRARDAELSQAVVANEGDTIAAGYRVNPTRTRVVESPGGQAALKQGVEPKTVALLQSATPLGKKRMQEMLQIARKGKENARYEIRNRPSDIPGDALINRVKIIRSANRSAGERIDKVAQTLKGQRVDVNPVVNDFMGKLNEMGIRYNPNSRSLDFSESDIRGLSGIESTVTRVIRQMEGKGDIDAYDVHRMKRILDEQLTYGKNAEGLGGRVEKYLKDLRRGLDGVLDEQFKAYNRVNTQYAETIGALDALQDVAGTKMNLSGGNADKALGTLLRRITSNAQSRVRLLDAVDEVDGVARKYLKSDSTDIVPLSKTTPRGEDIAEIDLDDDLLAQVRFMSDIERLFGTSAPTSLQGVMENVEGPAMRAAMTGDTTEMKVGMARSALNAIRGINEENTIKALETLLKE